MLFCAVRTNWGSSFSPTLSFFGLIQLFSDPGNLSIHGGLRGAAFGDALLHTDAAGRGTEGGRIPADEYGMTAKW